MKPVKNILLVISLVLLASCQTSQKEKKPMQNNRNLTAKEIFNKPEFLAISYGGYRKKTRKEQPTIQQLKEDLKILHAMDIRILRTYNVRLDRKSVV